MFQASTIFFISLPRIATRFGCRLAAATLGADLASWPGRALRSTILRPLTLKPLDTTGAGDIFHAGFAFALLRGDGLPQILEFSCAAAGLACMGPGARGGIAPLREIENLVGSGLRRPAAFSKEQLPAAGAPR